MKFASMRSAVIVASTVLLSLASASANAQGTWYTNYNMWRSLVTNVQTAEYNSGPENLTAPWIENDITATTGVRGWYTEGGFLSTFKHDPVTFTFAGNAFGGYFGLDGSASGTMQFNAGGSVYSDLSVTNRSNGYTFLGYISDSSSDINVTVSSSKPYVAVDSFSRANSINTYNPGSNVAPEPGTFALALTGGGALLGICIRRRRMAG